MTSFTRLTWASVPAELEEIGKEGRRRGRMMAENWMRLRYKLISKKGGIHKCWVRYEEGGEGTYHIGKENMIKTTRSATRATETEARNTLCHCQFIRRWFCPICICICVSFRLRFTKSLPLELRLACFVIVVSVSFLLRYLYLFPLRPRRVVSFGWWAESDSSERNCNKRGNYARFNYVK